MAHPLRYVESIRLYVIKSLISKYPKIKCDWYLEYLRQCDITLSNIRNDILFGE